MQLKIFFTCKMSNKVKETSELLSRLLFWISIQGHATRWGKIIPTRTEKDKQCPGIETNLQLIILSDGYHN